ncbi:MAG: hypothetical protein ACREBR_03585 [bacterium]
MASVYRLHILLVHPCLLWKKVHNQIIMVLDYVDDMLYFSTHEAAEKEFA